MIKKNLPFILLALGAALIAYMHCTHNNRCCGSSCTNVSLEQHKHDTHEHHHTHSHAHSHDESCSN